MKLMLPLLAAAIVAIATPAIAAPPSFHALEHRHAGERRVEAARDAYAAHLPAGTPIADARAHLEKAGARCTDGATMRCTWNGFEADHDMLRSVHWTVDVRHENGLVTDHAIDRQSLGA